ncbi:MAG: hypothetical protein GSR84_09080 [Desulfurococcales archaeon]|nr:hypothetical protein [Desulfurococcales archaeon]
MPHRVEGAFKVTGPASLRIVEGTVRLLGATLGEGTTITVPVGRTYLASTPGALVDVAPGPDRITQASPEEYEEYEDVARQVKDSRNPVIVGPTDVGKSTLAAWALNLASSSRDARLMTTDVGQNEVYCPGFIALAKPLNGIALPGAAFDVEASCFVGSFTPARAEARYLLCSSRLSRRPSWTIVDTDGWVTPWDGLELKAALASSIGSSLIVAMGLPQSHVRYLEDASGVEVLAIQARAGHGKSREERRRHRERLLAKHLVGGKSRPIKAGETPVYGAPVFVGTPLQDPGKGAVYGEETPSGVVRIVKGEPRGRGALRLGWEKGLLAGLVNGEMAYPGVVERIIYQRQVVVVYTRYDGPVDHLVIGTARIDLGPYTGKTH